MDPLVLVAVIGAPAAFVTALTPLITRFLDRKKAAEQATRIDESKKLLDRYDQYIDRLERRIAQLEGER